MTATILIQADDFASIADLLRQIESAIRNGANNGRQGDDFDFDITEGDHLDAINEILTESFNAPIAHHHNGDGS
jgi:hypothetical protein